MPQGPERMDDILKGKQWLVAGSRERVAQLLRRGYVPAGMLMVMDAGEYERATKAAFLELEGILQDKETP